MHRLERRLAKVLELSNQTRAMLGIRTRKTVPKGRKSELVACPLAVLLKPCGVIAVYLSFALCSSNKVARRLARIWNKPLSIKNNSYIAFPQIFKQFISDFDNNHYPHLVQRS